VRLATIGFVYQFHHLLPEFSALDNVALPLLIAGQSRKGAAARAGALLGELGLGERVEHQPAQLSGGEQQRVAVARALANSPRLLLADEPTGNLDPHTSTAVFDNLYDLARRQGVAAVVATHNLELARHMDRVLGAQGRPPGALAGIEPADAEGASAPPCLSTDEHGYTRMAPGGRRQHRVCGQPFVLICGHPWTEMRAPPARYGRE
jgi:ABC-type nitrate/sulfonate/bicarbonate transport system ATPase subunit